MALEIVFGTDTERLADSLAASISEEMARPGRDPLVPVTVLVPNRNMEKWLRFRIAASNGVAANLSFPYLENGLWDIVSEIGAGTGHGDLTNIRRFDRDDMNARVALCLLQDCADHEMSGSQLVQYCLSGGEVGERGFCIRLWQLACRLAELFREYEFNRTTMIRGWISGERRPGRHDPEYEQARYYLRINGFQNDVSTGTDFSEDDDSSRSLFQIGEAVLSAESDAAPAGQPLRDNETVFIFGLSNLSRYHCKLMWDIGRHRDVRLYHVNGCREYWQDVSTPFEDRWKNIIQTGISVTGPDSDINASCVTKQRGLLSTTYWIGKTIRKNVLMLITG